jgi:hypothetical protein
MAGVSNNKGGSCPTRNKFFMGFLLGVFNAPAQKRIDGITKKNDTFKVYT